MVDLNLALMVFMCEKPDSHPNRADRQETHLLTWGYFSSESRCQNSPFMSADALDFIGASFWRVRNTFSAAPVSRRTSVPTLVAMSSTLISAPNGKHMDEVNGSSDAKSLKRLSDSDAMLWTRILILKSPNWVYSRQKILLHHRSVFEWLFLFHKNVTHSILRHGGCFSSGVVLCEIYCCWDLTSWILLFQSSLLAGKSIS